jgi:hypothetical protein
MLSISEKVVHKRFTAAHQSHMPVMKCLQLERFLVRGTTSGRGPTLIFASQLPSGKKTPCSDLPPLTMSLEENSADSASTAATPALASGASVSSSKKGRLLATDTLHSRREEPLFIANQGFF